MTQLVWLIIVCLRPFGANYLKIQKPMGDLSSSRVADCYTGIMLFFSYTWLTMSQPFTLPFLIFPILFIVLGLLMLNKEKNEKTPNLKKLGLAFLHV